MTPRPLRQFVKRLCARTPFKRPVLEVMRRTVRLPRHFTGHLNFQGTFSVQIDKDHQFKLQHWGYLIENDLFWNGFGNGYEATSLQIWRRLAAQAQVIVDVGANTGIYTLIACCVNRTATVVALEPVERVFYRLRINVELNGYDARLEQVAASDTHGTATIYDLSRDHEYTASLDRSMSADCGGVVQYLVPTKRLDDIIAAAKVDRVDLVKIDVEQFEPQVLIGMSTCLSHYKPVLLIEILNERVATQVNDIIAGLGYKVFHVVEGRGLAPSDRVRATGEDGRNYLLIQDEVAKRTNIQEFAIG